MVVWLFGDQLLWGGEHLSGEQLDSHDEAE